MKNSVMLDSVVSCWRRRLPVCRPSSSSTRRKTYEALCQSISLLYCLSCWVSVSHVGALAVKTSVDEVSADTVPLLNQWPLKVWEQAWLSHGVRGAPSWGRPAVLSPAAAAAEDVTEWVWRRSFAEAHLHAWLHHKADSSHMLLGSHHRDGNKQPKPQCNLHLPIFFFFKSWGVFHSQTSQQMVKVTTVCYLADK